MLSWFEGMSRKQRNAFWACFWGWALDAMSVQFFAFIIPTLLVIWRMTKAQAGFISTSALISSAVGGVVAGVLADRIGRVRILKLTILWFSVFTGLSAFTFSFEQLLFTRILQGVGFGGEWAAGAILIGEVVENNIRGRAVGSVQAGWPIGYGIAALAYWAVYTVLPEAVGWRVLFAIGFLPGLLVLWISRHVEESSAFHATAEYRKKSSFLSTFVLVFSARVLPRTIMACVMAAGALGGNYTILTWLVTYLRETQQLTIGNTSLFLAVNILGSFCGYVCMAYMSDFLGRRKTFSISAAGAVITVLIYTLLNLPVAVTLILGFPIGFFQSGIISGMGACFTELFPAQVRSSASGFSYNFGRGIGALAPTGVGLTSATIGLAPSIGMWAACSYALVFAAAIFLPETRNAELKVHV